MGSLVIVRVAFTTWSSFDQIVDTYCSSLRTLLYLLVMFSFRETSHAVRVRVRVRVRASVAYRALNSPPHATIAVVLLQLATIMLAIFLRRYVVLVDVDSHKLGPRFHGSVTPYLASTEYRCWTHGVDVMSPTIKCSGAFSPR